MIPPSPSPPPTNNNNDGNLVGSATDKTKYGKVSKIFLWERMRNGRKPEGSTREDDSEIGGGRGRPEKNFFLPFSPSSRERSLDRERRFPPMVPVATPGLSAGENVTEASKMANPFGVDRHAFAVDLRRVLT